MKIDITYTSKKLFLNPRSWFWYFKRYTYIKGFIIRICGIHINIREKNGTAKMIAKYTESIS